MNRVNKALEIILNSTEPMQASLFLNGRLLATGTPTLDTSGRLLVFLPNDQTILDTVHPEAMMRVVGLSEESISVTNLRPCSTGSGHWHMEVVV